MHLNVVQEDACTQGKFIASSWPGKKWHLVEGVKGNVDMQNVGSCLQGVRLLEGMVRLGSESPSGRRQRWNRWE